MGRHNYTLQSCGVPMAQALTPEQQEVARLGLRIISTGYGNGLSIGAALAAARVYIGRRADKRGKTQRRVSWVGGGRNE